MELNKDDYMELLKEAIAEQKHFVDMTTERFNFTIKMIVSIIAAVLLGVFKATEWYHVACLIIGPVLTLYLAKLGLRYVMRMHEATLETISTRAKIEHKLGLDISVGKKDGNNASAWYATESLIPQRHLDARDMYRSSSEFISASPSGGDVKNYSQVFEVVILVSIILIILLLLMVCNMFGS